MATSRDLKLLPCIRRLVVAITTNRHPETYSPDTGAGMLLVHFLCLVFEWRWYWTRHYFLQHIQTGASFNLLISGRREDLRWCRAKITLMLANKILCKVNFITANLNLLVYLWQVYTHKFQYLTPDHTFVSDTSVYVYRSCLKGLSVSVGGKSLVWMPL